VSIENALESLIGELEQDRSLNELWHLRQRVEALDQLDVYLLVGQASGTALRHRARAIYTKFESVNSRLYEGIRRNIQRGAGGSRLREWMPAGKMGRKPRYRVTSGAVVLSDLEFKANRRGFVGPRFTLVLFGQRL
jgi:hypothetical protein